ncbi:hypothetical protein [Trichothermofontia sp.]
MNRESESLEAYLRHWLLGETDPPGPLTGSPEPIEVGDREDLLAASSTFQEPVVYLEVMELNRNPLDSYRDRYANRAESSDQRDTLDSEIDSELESYRRSSGYPPLVKRGIPAVQDRFQALLKRRLKQEILRHPPLFPWETQVTDYESDVEVGLESPRERQLVHAWIAQLRDLPLPIPMGEPVLAQILEQCQTVAQSSLQTGAKLVRAVEALFPGQFLALNQLTELVLMSPTRGPQALLGQVLPTSYEQADTHQQMLLSLLAARELLTALTLVLPADRQPLERTWQTTKGPVELRITTDIEAGTPYLRVQTQFPCGGQVQLRGEAGQTTAQRSLAGPLMVVLQAVGFEQPYTLTLELQAGEETTPPSALTFTLRADQPFA